MIYFKEGVKIKYLTSALVWMFNGLMLYEADLTVTSIFDGEHMTNSRHYKGEALDVRSKTMNRLQKEKFMAEMPIILGAKFTVLFENQGEMNEHFHIQVKKGMKFP